MTFSTVYTDGSVQQSKKRGGWAAIIRGGEDKVISGNMSTADNYDAELMAIYQAVHQSEGGLCIVTDHMGIARELKRMISDKDWRLPEKCKPLWMNLKYEAEGRIFEVRWVKGNTLKEQRQAHNLANIEACKQTFER